MTLSAEDVNKFNETIRAMPYWDLWKSVDAHWDRVFDPNDPVSSWEEEVREAEIVAAERQRQAIDKAVAQGQLQRLQQAAWRQELNPLTLI